MKEEAGSWALLSPNNGNVHPPPSLGPGTQPRIPGVQAVLLRRAGPPVATGPAVSLTKPTRVRLGEREAPRASEGGGGATRGGGFHSQGPRTPPGPAGQGRSSLRSPCLGSSREQAGGPESSAICQGEGGHGETPLPEGVWILYAQS